MSTDELYQIADELRGISNVGLMFAENEYHRERYEHVLLLSARLVAVIEDRAPDEILTLFFQDNLQHVSAMAGAEAVIFRDGKMLLIRRRDNGLWAVPGGFAEVGETLAEAALRELWEEAGVHGRVVQLLGVFDSRLWQSRTKSQLYHTIFQVESEDTPAAGSEAMDVRFFPEHDLPGLSPGHDLRVPVLFRLLRGELPIPYFDR